MHTIIKYEILLYIKCC